MTIYEEREVTRKESVPVREVCDICGEESKHLQRIIHYHNSWGNDSIDSYEYIEICGKDECYLGAFEKFEKSNNADYDSAVFDDMDYSKLKIMLGK